MSIEPILVDPAIGDLSKPELRQASVPEASAIAKIVNELVQPNTPFRATLADECKKVPVGPPKGDNLRALLAPLVQSELQDPGYAGILASISEPEIYSCLADFMSQELLRSKVSGGATSESLILNYAILIYHFYRWHTPLSHLQGKLAELDQGVSGIRGKLISIQNRHRGAGNSNDFSPPVNPFIPASLAADLRASSDTLDAIDRESNVIEGTGGFLTRLTPVSNPASPNLLASSRNANQQTVEAGRNLIYPQYEHTALLFMSLAGIEFLLRSFTPLPSSPEADLLSVVDLHPDLPSALKRRLLEISSSEQWNIRNRCMHGSFLEIEGRREDLLRGSGILESQSISTVDLSTDGSLPKNISAIVLTALNDLAHHLALSRSQQDKSWTTHFLLSAQEEQEAEAIHCDILQSAEAALAWVSHIRNYVRAVAPCLSTPLQLGIVSWVRNNGSKFDTIPGFYFLSLLLEPLLRLTLLVSSRPVLQQTLSGSGSNQRFHVQYLMLDSRGMLNPGNVDWLIDHVDEVERPVAERVFWLAMKCRDAFAHGAVHDFSENTRRVYGHVIIKAIQLIVEAGTRQLTPNLPQQLVSENP